VTVGQISIPVVNIPKGTFKMGSPETEPNRNPDETQHLVTLSAYKLSKYEISNKQFAEFLNIKSVGAEGIGFAGEYGNRILLRTNSTEGLVYNSFKWKPVTGKANAPVIYVTWYGALAFANYMGGRLPTEAEWEYAARAKTTTSFYTGDCLNNTQANYNWEFSDGCSNTITTPPNTTQNVGSYAPNAYGLYDMHGNVFEWCADWYAAYPTGAATNPTGPGSGSNRVIRGGGWINDAERLRSAYRNFPYGVPHFLDFHVGFRLVFS
jgi:sulfatase modifying factor 1